MDDKTQSMKTAKVKAWFDKVDQAKDFQYEMKKFNAKIETMTRDQDLDQILCTLDLDITLIPIVIDESAKAGCGIISIDRRCT